VKTAHLHSCTVLQLSADTRRLWHFGFSSGQPTLSAEHEGLPSDPLPPKWAGRDWRTLYQRKLNLAWLPSDKVFLRVIQLPVCEPSELPAMIELQLEKLSPLPVAQIVWSYELIRAATGDLLTVIVAIVARNLVEEFLGRLEGQGYVADRLEVPLLHQLLATKCDGQGVWIFPSNADGENLCLVAWWNEGTLQNLNLLYVPTIENWDKILGEQLTQIAWSGEMEGWLTRTPACSLVADPETTAVWEPVLSQWAGKPIQTVPSLQPPELAALNAKRVSGEESRASLMPIEYTTRYRQQFVDRLWMGGLLALGALYVLGVLIYFGALQVVYFQQNRVASKIAGLSQAFTNSMQLQARVQVLQEQANLRYAGLECWKAACVNLPAELTLSSYAFQQGKTLTLYGTAPADQLNQIVAYNKSMMDYRVGETNGPPFFSQVQPYNTRPGFGGAQNLVEWNFACELRRTDTE
jgi:hypothetical protein